ncbi:hypothetical protein SAMN05444414_11627 [Roseovarius marisflavi]|uniref:Uncharacterized protein n=1 Tax=Roseovarius marisflavi TaxID=1054996 RepID=A0A1M7B3L5_9RHOB|nr:hypothetical protein SAMN05444414_11627 [Roseovarius marisflavi]
MVDRKTPARPSRDDGKHQTPSNNTRNDSLDYSEGKRGGFDVSPTRPAPACKPDRGQGEEEG